jgi:hypothetical protein
LSIKPWTTPTECGTDKGQPGTANEVIAYATSTSVTGPFAYQGIIMCGSSTEWTNQPTIMEVQAGDDDGNDRLVLVYHDGPDPATQTNNARQRRLHSECLYAYNTKFMMVTRSAPQAINLSGDRQWCLNADRPVTFMGDNQKYYKVASDGSVTASAASILPESMFDWKTMNSSTYNEGYLSGYNGKWLQLRRNSGDGLWARGASWGDWEAFDNQFSATGFGWGNYRDNRGQYVKVNTTTGTIGAGGTTPLGSSVGQGRSALMLLAD